MECVRPAWGVLSWVRPSGREDVKAFTRDSFPDFGRPRIRIFRVDISKDSKLPEARLTPDWLGDVADESAQKTFDLRLCDFEDLSDGTPSEEGSILRTKRSWLLYPTM